MAPNHRNLPKRRTPNPATNGNSNSKAKFIEDALSGRNTIDNLKSKPRVHIKNTPEPSLSNEQIGILNASSEEITIVKELYSAGLEELSDALRTYAGLKHGVEAGNDDLIAKFSANLGKEILPEELMPIAWEPTENLLKELSSSINALVIRRNKGPEKDKAGVISPEAQANYNYKIKTATQEIVSHIVRYYKANDIAEPGMSDANLQRDAEEAIPLFERMVQATINNPQQGQQLLNAIKSKVHGKELTESQVELLKEHEKLVDDWSKLLTLVGYSIAAGPGNLFSRYLTDLLSRFEDYLQYSNDLKTDSQKPVSSIIIAEKINKEVLEIGKSALTIVSTLKNKIEETVDYQGKHIITPESLEIIEQFLNQFNTPNDTKLPYSQSQCIEECIKITPKLNEDEAKDRDTLVNIVLEGHEIAYNALDVTREMREHIKALKKKVEISNEIAISDPDFRELHFGVKLLTQRLKLINEEVIAITQVQDVPVKLQKLSELVTQYANMLKEKTDKDLKAGMEALEAFSSNAFDQYDAALHLFTKLHERLTKMVEYTEKRDQQLKQTSTLIV